MRKTRKVKYKDVVPKQGTNSRNNSHSRKRPHVASKSTTFNKKRKFHNQPNRNIEIEESVEINDVKQQETMEESSSSDEDVDDLKQLQEMLGIKHKQSIAIDSDTSEDSDDDSIIQCENSNNIENQEGNDERTDVLSDNSFSDSDENDFAEDTEVEINTSSELPDTFLAHFSNDIHENLLNSLQNYAMNSKKFNLTWSTLGKLVIHIPHAEIPASEQKAISLEEKAWALLGKVPEILSLDKSNFERMGIKSQIIPNLSSANESMNKNNFTSLQSEIFSIINNYQDFYFPERTFNNSEQIRFVYCLHALNHVLKTRFKVLHHNSRLVDKDDVPEAFRDQGLVRPKVLIIVPFKDSAYKIVNCLMNMLVPEGKGKVMNKKRFVEEYTGNEIVLPQKNRKPEDYENTFTGNVADDFRLSLSVTKKSLKLYADFYSSDLIIASPLGLRTVIAAEGEPERDYDFLSSIELLILDQTELFLMQNWDHLLHVFQHIHLQPKSSHGTNFSRVRTWSLNGWSKYYRQTLIFSSIILPEINSIFNKKCMNYAGKVKVSNVISGTIIKHVIVQLPHVFYKFEPSSAAEAMDSRFDFFIRKVLPIQKEALMKQTLIFVANYFDYVRLRNYFKKEDIGFTQICEYSKEGKIAKARDMFFHGSSHFLLYTERYHFFNRIRIKGIRHLVFYQLPSFPHFYSEISNFMQENYMNKKVGSTSNMSVTVMYSKYDVHQLSAIVGTERAAKMVQSEKDLYMMVTGVD